MSAMKLKSEDSKVTIKIPGILYNRLSEIVTDSGFNSVTDFIVYVLRDLVSTRKERSESNTLDETRLSKEEVLKRIYEFIKTFKY